MNLFTGISRVAAAVAISWLGMLAMPAEKGPSVAIQWANGNPSAGKAVEFRPAFRGPAETFAWDFGDGTTSSERAPKHVYAEPGTYQVTVTMQGAEGSATTSSVIEVTQSTTLRLLSAAGHAFDVSLHAINPNPAQNHFPPTDQGEAIPQNDVFGYFTLPHIVPIAAGAPVVPEVFVKILDARGIGGDFWVFWGGLTSFEYTLTVRDTVRGTVKLYTNPATGSPGCLGDDTRGFANGTAATATPTVSTTPVVGATRNVRVGQGGGFRFTDDVSGNSTTTIEVGDTVHWIWVSDVHSTTSGTCCTGNGLWDSGEHSGITFDHTFNAEGSFPYFCTVHGTMMTGMVVVQPRGTSGAGTPTPTRNPLTGTPTEIPTRSGGYE